MVYLDEDLPNHPKVFRAGITLGPTGPALVLALHVACIAYARKYLTDGFVPIEFFATNSLIPKAIDVAKAMASRRVKLLEPCRGGYRIHDFHEWNKKACDIKEKRESDRLRKQRQRSRHSGPVTQGVTVGQVEDVTVGLRADSRGHESLIPSHDQKQEKEPQRLRRDPSFPQPVENPTDAQLTKLAHTVVDEHPNDQFTDHKESLKAACSRKRFVCDAERIGKTLESVLAQRQRRTH